MIIIFTSIIILNNNNNNSNNPNLNIPELSTHFIVLENLTREYSVFNPINYSSSNTYPMLIYLHGGGQSNIPRTSLLFDLAKSHNFILVLPKGLEVPGVENSYRWVDDGREAVFPYLGDAKDIEFIQTVVHEVSQIYPTDTSNIFIAGVSNGGFMIEELLRNDSTLFQAAAMFLSSIPRTEKSIERKPTHPIPVLLWRGTLDNQLTYDGEARDASGPILSAQEALQWWGAVNGNNSFFDPITITQPDSQGCYTTLEGFNTTVPTYLYSSVGGGHIIPSVNYNFGNRITRNIFGHQCSDIEALEIMWEFFLKNSN